MGSHRERLHNVIRGALVSCIHDHGPITADNVASAAKRLTGQIVGMELDTLPETAATQRLRKRYEQLKHGHQRTLNHVARLQADLAFAEAQLRDRELSQSAAGGH
jgi:hypothetical protein